MKVSLVHGDITLQAVDAIVNAADSLLLGGGGVDGTIHRRGGPAILEACRRLRATEYPDGLPAGQAVATTAGALEARAVIHTVGPRYVPRSVGGVYTTDDPELSCVLGSCYRQSLRVAQAMGARSIAFPAVSAGTYGWPLKSAAEIAVTAVLSANTEFQDVRFVLFSSEALQAFEVALGKAGPSNRTLLATLAAQPQERWQELFAALDGLADGTIETHWRGGELTPSGARQMPYAECAPQVHALTAALSSLGAVFPFNWPSWSQITRVDFEGPETTAADAARYVTSVVRGERFGEGTIGAALAEGKLQAAVRCLRSWYERLA